jgi:PAS domain S-box-containing protein
MADSYADIESIKKTMHGSRIYYMVCVGMDETFTYVNPHYAKNFNFVTDQLVGQPYDINMHPDDTRVCKEVGAKCFEHPEKSFPAVIRKHNGKGGYVITLWEYRLIVKDGAPEGIFCIGHDITELEKQRMDLKSVTESLDKTKALLLKVAYEQSHTVRAPVANILGLISIMKNLEMDSNGTNILAMLEDASVQLDEVIRETIKSIYQ